MGAPRGVNNENSTTTALNASQTFTGSFVDVSEHGSVVVAIVTDQTATLTVDFSPNGSNVDSSLSFSISAAVNEVHRLTVTRKYARVRLTNTSVSNQTYIRLQTMVGDFPPLSAPLNNVIQQDADSIVARVIDSELDIAAGRYTGFAIVNKFGKNSDVDAAEDIWEAGADYTGFPLSAAETIQVVSASTNDTSSGSGARTIRITGLDTNYAIQSEDFTLNGTSAVTGTKIFRRVHTASVLTSGSSNTTFNDGIITVRHSTTTSNIFLSMLAGTNQTNCSAYTVPAGKTAYMRRITGSIRGNANATASGAIWVRGFGASPRYRRPFGFAQANDFRDEIYGGLVFTEKTDIILRITAVSTTNLEITGGYDLILVDN